MISLRNKGAEIRTGCVTALGSLQAGLHLRLRCRRRRGSRLFGSRSGRKCKQLGAWGVRLYLLHVDFHNRESAARQQQAVVIRVIDMSARYCCKDAIRGQNNVSRLANTEMTVGLRRTVGAHGARRLVLACCADDALDARYPESLSLGSVCRTCPALASPRGSVCALRGACGVPNERIQDPTRGITKQG